MAPVIFSGEVVMKSRCESDRRIKAVFWDIDGTLIDTEPLHYAVIRDWCLRRNYTLTEEDNGLLLGKSMAEKWEILRNRVPGGDTEESFRRECARDYVRRVGTDLERSDAVAVVRRLYQLGVPQATVSNGDREVVLGNLRALGLEKVFRFCISAEDIRNGKPDPEPYLVACTRMGVTPQEGVVVEDSLVGVAAGVAAGMTVVAWPKTGEKGAFGGAYRVLEDVSGFPWELFALRGE
jgi:beta-phosphoglucomutase-like phosphatase (HAD superfamily)